MALAQRDTCKFTLADLQHIRSSGQLEALRRLNAGRVKGKSVKVRLLEEALGK